MGSTRIKRRSKVLEESRVKAAKVSIPGMWVSEENYRIDTGKDPTEEGLSLHDVEDPLTGNHVKCVFMPKHKSGYYEGTFTGTNKLTFAQQVDDDVNALRDGQVEQSFATRSSSYRKSLPQCEPNVPTAAEYFKAKERGPIEDVKKEDEEQDISETVATCNQPKYVKRNMTTTQTQIFIDYRL